MLKTSLRRVPQITVFFWVIKLFSTALGEATSDYLVHRFNPYVAVVVGFTAFIVAIVLQFSKHRYIAWVYWLAVTMVAIFGTMAADVLHVGLGIPYVVSAAFFLVALIVVFAVWYVSEKSLSIHSIYSTRRELFYWAAILTTFALGTATGDLTAYTLHLGFLISGIVFATLFALPALAYWLFNINGILAFWFAYIMTRPLGASFADWAGKPKDAGGIGLGSGQVSLVLAIIMIALVVYISITHIDDRSEKGSLAN